MFKFHKVHTQQKLTFILKDWANYCAIHHKEEKYQMILSVEWDTGWLGNYLSNWPVLMSKLSYWVFQSPLKLLLRRQQIYCRVWVWWHFLKTISYFFPHHFTFSHFQLFCPNFYSFHNQFQYLFYLKAMIFNGLPPSTSLAGFSSLSNN